MRDKCFRSRGLFAGSGVVEAGCKAILTRRLNIVRHEMDRELARDIPVSGPAVEQAVELARRGVITHLTIHGERVAAIVPES